MIAQGLCRRDRDKYYLLVNYVEAPTTSDSMVFLRVLYVGTEVDKDLQNEASVQSLSTKGPRSATGSCLPLFDKGFYIVPFRVFLSSTFVYALSLLEI